LLFVQRHEAREVALIARFIVMTPVWLIGTLAVFAVLAVLLPFQLVCWLVGDQEFRHTLPCAPIITAWIRADEAIDDFVTGERSRDQRARRAAVKASLPHATARHRSSRAR
jgi:hypothetical protein